MTSYEIGFTALALAVGIILGLICGHVGTLLHIAGLL